ncbi:hypothetical protein [Larsenimonas rhizosphaerae]|uniref:hypothetical protein n=1 Tax=Larsenimonas rhizosphaerae TaxID=2944682 RepID=UPI002033A41C|nr:hypothetical protein [Larsenimonas rhizosphaerae]MCM2132040.1 hypothetical protein [Larsenimonas rhizosphaerae]
MNARYFPWILGAGVCAMLSAQPVLAKSAALERAEAAASQNDVSSYITSASDGVSQTIFLGNRPVDHTFQVKEEGDYLISSQSFPGESGDYRVSASLKDQSGQVLAEDQGNERSNGFNIRKHLTAGEYTVTVTGQSRGPTSGGNQSVTIWVRNADAVTRQENGLADSNRVTRLAPEAGSAASSTATTASSAAVSSAGHAEPSGASNQADGGAPRQTAEAPNQAGATTTSEVASQTTIVREVPIRTNDDVLKFEVVQPGRVSLESATFGGYRGTYRIKAQLKDAQGNIVAENSGQGADGDFHIEQRLEPGTYTVHIEGQKFGSARSGTNSFTLRIRQLDAS